MIPQDQELLRSRLLQALQAVGDAGRGVQLLLNDSRMAGFDALTLPELERELRNLADQRWVIAFSPPIGGQRYRLTEIGASKLREAGL